MEEHVRPNPWGEPVKEIKEVVSVETPKSNKLTYLVIGLGAALVVSVVVLGFVVYKQAMTNPTPEKTVVTSSSLSSLSSSSSSLSSLTSTSSSVNSSLNTTVSSSYYKYNTNTGKYIIFDYPTEAKIKVLGFQDKEIKGYDTIASIKITLDNVAEITIDKNSAIDASTSYKYDSSKPNQIEWTVAGSSQPDGSTIKGTYTFKKTPWSFYNSKLKYTVVDITELKNANVNKEIRSNFIVQDSLMKNTFNSSVNEYLFVPYWTVKDNTSTFTDNETYQKKQSVLVKCYGTTLEDTKKCVEVLDRFLTTFKVKSY